MWACCAKCQTVPLKFHTVAFQLRCCRTACTAVYICPAPNPALRLSFQSSAASPDPLHCHLDVQIAQTGSYPPGTPTLFLNLSMWREKKNWYFFATLQFHNRDYPRRNNFLQSERSGHKGSSCCSSIWQLVCILLWRLSLSCMLWHELFTSLKGWIKSKTWLLIKCNRLESNFRRYRGPNNSNSHSFCTEHCVSGGASHTSYFWRFTVGTSSNQC